VYGRKELPATRFKYRINSRGGSLRFQKFPIFGGGNRCFTAVIVIVMVTIATRHFFISFLLLAETVPLMVRPAPYIDKSEYQKIDGMYV